MIISIFLLHYLFLSSVTAAVTNITIDQHALLVLKTHITHDPNNLLAKNWSTSSSVCNWIGITCGVRHQRVIALNISYLNLTGTIPSQLGNLSFLSMLAIRNNSFYGSLPDELAQLRRLKYIDFNFNNFNIEIPSWFGSLSKLQRLHLNENNFVGTIPETLANLSSLKELFLAGNQLSGSISSSIFSISSLEVVDFSKNQLTGSFPYVIFNLSSLSVIDFGFNELSGHLPANICDYHPNLIYLLLSHNMFEGQLPSSLSKCGQLQYLSVSFNQFTGAIPREIGNMTKLLRIFLGYNKFRGEIPEELGNLAEVEFLHVANNELRGTIPSTIFNLSSLVYADLSNNNLTGSLPYNMCQHLPVLEELYLFKNQIHGGIPHNLWQCTGLRTFTVGTNQLTGSIPRDIGNMTSINILYLDSNYLTGVIPFEIGSLRNLQNLSLEINNLVGHVPASIFNMSSLIDLSVSNNGLSGDLPSSIDIGLPNLESLYLASNYFSGTIPNSITNLSKLTVLEMANNSFSGYIPNTFGNLRSLQWFSLAANNLTSSSSVLDFLSSLTSCKNIELIQLSQNPLNGVLPSSIGNLSSSLQILTLENCSIGGRIPKEIGNLRNLIVLGLGENELTESIPVTLGKLQNLQGMYLYDNSLTGLIPEELCSLDRLADIYMGRNKLYGSIPSCFSSLSSLRRLSLGSNCLTSIIPSTLRKLRDLSYLNLSSNFLNGSLPLEIGNLKAVRILDLSRNYLSGDIPAIMGNLIDLQILSLQGNAFNGPIPESLGNMKSLVSLDLSNNDISGVIPKSMETLLYINNLNMSFNQLEGEIPTKGPFAKFSAESFMGNLALCGSSKLQVSPCKTLGHRKSKTKHVLWIVLPPSIALSILVPALILVLLKYRQRRTKLPNDVNMSAEETWRKISYHELYRATDGFSADNLLGIGGFGSVYKGRLQDGIELAIKVFHQHLEGAFKSFDAECEVIKNMRHRNLVKVISSCSNEDFKALVLEYMSKGSLEKWLYSHNYFLDILQRLNIMIDIASALEYLHFGYFSVVVHCDLKPNNVLLDENMVAHLSDFGIAKLLAEEATMTQTETLGTIGYMAPEFGTDGKISRKCDVYSYGIMVMETFTRRKPTDQIFVEEMSLKQWVNDSLDNRVVEVVDANMLRMDDEHFATKKECILSILSLARECTREIPEERINIKEVLTRLVKIRVKFLANNGTAGGRRRSNIT